MYRFHIGEVALVLHRTGIPMTPLVEKYSGTEVTIQSELRPDPPMVSHSSYVVRAFDGEVLSVCPTALIKRRPPREDLRLVDWSECPWRPGQKRRVYEDEVNHHLAACERWLKEQQS